MNAVTIVIASMCILAIAYRLYGTFMMVKVLKVNDDKPTPAHALEDGKTMCLQINGFRSAIILRRSRWPGRWSDRFWPRSSAICRGYYGC